MSSEFFQKAENFTIANSSFNHVAGSQYNYHTTIIQKPTEARTYMNEFHCVKRGAICRLKDIWCYQYPRDWDRSSHDVQWRRRLCRADRTICTARVLKEQDMVFTVVQYSGPEGRKAFEEDFRMLSSILTSDASQIYGYTHSYIPSLILYSELVPVAHLENVGILGWSYLHSLHRQLGCKEEELWIDSGRKVICRGPPGPRPNLGWSALGIDLPLSADLLREDVLLRFLASLKKPHDRFVVVVAVDARNSDVHAPERVSQPTVISTSTNTIIAVANNVWTSADDGLSGRSLLENGSTSFVLADRQCFLLIWNQDAENAWLSQAPSIFHARGISLEEDLGGYQVVYPNASLFGFFPRSKAQRKQRSRQPIYFFVCPPPLDPGKGNPFSVPKHKCTLSSIHYWSFDRDGRSRLSNDVCRNLGLPIELELRYFGHRTHSCCNVSYELNSPSWSNVSYKLIHQYQLLRGFDPTTTDFARHIGSGNHIFRPLNHSGRSVQVQQVPSPWDELSNDSISTAPSAEGSETDTSKSTGFWSSVFSPFASTVSQDSDILTIGF
ncbi:hypothetical protein PM082_010158 [Marasmius tenuissimus]|nr:hypothetical protein PM082_010158 [Marasmius tenuissimus]